jgi:hypothetical protein
MIDLASSLELPPIVFSNKELTPIGAEVTEDGEPEPVAFFAYTLK